MTLQHTQRDGWNWLGAHKGWTLQGIYKYVKMPRNSMSLKFTALDFPPCCHQNPAECGERGCPLSVTPQRCAEKCRILGLRVGRFTNSPFWVIKKHLFFGRDLSSDETSLVFNRPGVIQDWVSSEWCWDYKLE